MSKFTEKMQKNNNSKVFDEVAKQSNESANLITIKNINSEDIVDFPHNNEDIENTLDLETSIRQAGFKDPLEVTDFGMEGNKYMIVSGHRRRSAGVKVGIIDFPCVITHFNNESELRNYVLMANSQRDSSKDPLLYAKRYKMHEDYLLSIGMKKNIVDEVAARLGISRPQANLYKNFNKVISQVRDLVQKEKISMSGVVVMASLSEDEQMQILDIFNKYLLNNEIVSRDKCKLIISLFKEGKTTYDDIFIENEDKETPYVSGVFINDEEKETINKEKERDPLRLNELRKEKDFYDEEGEANKYEDEKLTKEDYEVINGKNENEKNKSGDIYLKSISKLENIINEGLEFEDKEKINSAISATESAFVVILEEFQQLAKKHKVTIGFNKSLKNIIENLEELEE